jgi:hypothetical protein
MLDLRDTPPTTTTSRRHLLLTWVIVVTIAEFLGFAVPATVGAVTAGEPVRVALPALLLAGAVEGAMLGTGQALVLWWALPGLPARRWVWATSAAAVVAYAIGLLPSTFAGVWGDWPPVAVAAAAVPLAVALLASIGTAQWLILRRHVRRAGRWILATTVAWTVGLAVFLGFTMPLWRPGQPVAAVIAVGLAGGLLMAATTSVITGWALVRLSAERERPVPAGPPALHQQCG